MFAQNYSRVCAEESDDERSPRKPYQIQSSKVLPVPSSSASAANTPAVSTSTMKRQESKNLIDFDEDDGAPASQPGHVELASFSNGDLDPFAELARRASPLATSPAIPGSPAAAAAAHQPATAPLHSQQLRHAFSPGPPQPHQQGKQLSQLVLEQRPPTPTSYQPPPPLSATQKQQADDLYAFFFDLGDPLATDPLSALEPAAAQPQAAPSSNGSTAAAQPTPTDTAASKQTASISTPAESKATGSESTAADNSANEQGHSMDQRELHIYAIPLTKKRLVFLPVTAWTEDPEPAATGVGGRILGGFTKLQEKITGMWQSMKEKDSNTFQHKIYAHGQAIIENMTAEERLMRNIPKAASKVIIFHPVSIPSDDVQEQLTRMASKYVMKSAGKAAAAGLLLPVAVGIEILAIPGTGWYALYQLYKNSVSAAGGQRLNEYLNAKGDVRVCYAGDPRLDQYIERVKLSPNGILTSDDLDDLVHDLKEPSLLHPLNELRNRYVKRYVTQHDDYALLPVNAPEGLEMPAPPGLMDSDNDEDDNHNGPARVGKQQQQQQQSR